MRSGRRGPASSGRLARVSALLSFALRSVWHRSREMSRARLAAVANATTRATGRKMPRMMTRLAPIALAVATLLAPDAAAAQSATAAPGSDETLPQPGLKAAPRLVAPPVSPPALPSGTGGPAVSAPAAADGGAVFLRADRIDGTAEKFVEAAGSVELRTRRETVLADWLRYDFASDEIWGKGDVLIRHGIDWITGPEVRFKRGAETGFFTSPRFYVGENFSRGSAAEIRFAGPDLYEATDAHYTTCVAPHEDWYVRMGELEVDRARKVGTGHDATVYFFGAPVLYSPWFEFPLSNERKSGFLTPTTGLTGIRGFEYSQPYYLNLAPNYDATITPRFMTKRGMQLGAQGRYLFDHAQGEASAEYLHNDRVTGTNRYALASMHTQNLDFLPGLIGYWNLNKVSDDTYFSDLSDRVGLTSQTTLPREGGFTYSSGPWQVLARAQGFQTLQDPTAPQPIPYNRVPQALVTLHELDWRGLTFAGVAEYAYFRQPTLTTGQRVYLWPTVAWERQGAAWSVALRTGAHLRQYDLNEQRPDFPSSFGYAIPISSVDGSLVFERELNIAERSFVQTLEPRAFYVYVPHRDQSKAPVFDTAVDDFNFGQLFSVNRYLGNDRIGDANQLTLALTSRLLDQETGGERLRVAVGQRLYFQDQKVVLNEPPRSAATSDALFGVEGRLSDAWALIGLWQYNLDASQTERLNAGVRYTPAPGRVFNASYTYSRQYIDPTSGQSQLNQFDLSWQLPLNPSWTLLGRWNFSVLDSKTLEAVAGVEYNADCWAMRLVGQRLTTTSQTTTNSVYLQIELNGLARFGTSPLELLRRSVPGYQQSNDPTVSPRFRDDAFQEY
jgi:LPS-assembly protein